MPRHILTLTFLTSLSSWPRVAAYPSLSIALILCEYVEVMMSGGSWTPETRSQPETGVLPGSCLALIFWLTQKGTMSKP